MAALKRFVDKWIITVMALAVAALALITATVVVYTNRTFDPISYGPQTIERVNPDGTVSVPSVPGYEEPAIRLGDTVPVRGTRANSSDHDISLSGSIVWAEDPPGRRWVVDTGVPGVAPPGVTQLRFENEIPEGVADFVRRNGPTKFAIKGRTDLLEPGGVGTTWATPTFLLVP